MSKEPNNEDIIALVVLREYCKENALSFEIGYSEAEDVYHGMLRGPGRGEGWEVKRHYSIESASSELIQLANKFYDRSK